MFIMKTITQLAEQFTAHKNWSIATLGTYAAGDSRFFLRLRDGRVTLSQCARVALWMEQQWPHDLPWPLENLSRREFLMTIQIPAKSL